MTQQQTQMRETYDAFVDALNAVADDLEMPRSGRLVLFPANSPSASWRIGLRAAGGSSKPACTVIFAHHKHGTVIRATLRLEGTPDFVKAVQIDFEAETIYRSDLIQTVVGYLRDLLPELTLVPKEAVVHV